VHRVLTAVLGRVLVGLGLATAVATTVTLAVDRGRAPLVGAMGVLAAAWAASMFVLAVLNGRKAMRRLAVVSGIGGLVNLAAMASLLAAGRPSVVVVVLVAAAANGVMVPLGWRAVRELAEHGDPAGSGDVRAAVRFGLPNCLSELVILAATRADLIVVSAFLSARAVGLYAVAIALAEGLLMIPDAAAQVLVAHVAGGTSRRTTTRVGALAVGVTALGGLVLVALSSWLVGLLFGTDYHDAVHALPWLVASATLAGTWKMGRPARSRAARRTRGSTRRPPVSSP
jgi:O-antigen/teichoic acid export membrane protein